MAIFIGYKKRGWSALLVAGCAFILPAAIMVVAIADVRHDALPQVNGVLYALKPVVIAIVVQAFWKLAPTAVKSKWLTIVGLASAVSYAMHVHEILVLAISAVLALAPVLSRGLAGFKWLPAIPTICEIRGMCRTSL